MRRCLEKQPAERFRSAADLAFALEAVATLSSGAHAARLCTFESGMRREPSPHHFAGKAELVKQVGRVARNAARENLASTINRVCEDHAPVVITRNRDQAVVMLSLAEYESLQETAYLLRSPANARRLLAAVDTLKRGKGIKRKIKLGA